MNRVKIIVEGNFPEESIPGFATYKGWQEIITVTVPGVEDEPTTQTNVPNPVTAVQFVEEYFKNLCGKDIAAWLQKQQFTVMEQQFLQERQTANQLIEASIIENITTTSEII